MQKITVIKTAAAAGLLITALIFMILGNDVIFPSALVGFLLMVIHLFAIRGEDTYQGKAARKTITVIAVFVLTFNILASLLVPVIEANVNLTDHFEEETTDIGAETDQELEDHFVEVFINDAHELCYSTSFFLVINIGFLVVFALREKKKR